MPWCQPYPTPLLTCPAALGVSVPQCCTCSSFPLSSELGSYLVLIAAIGGTIKEVQLLHPKIFLSVQASFQLWEKCLWARKVRQGFGDRAIT